MLARLVYLHELIAIFFEKSMESTAFEERMLAEVKHPRGLFL